MAVEIGIRQLILADVDCADLVGERMDPNVLRPDTLFPALTYQRVSNVPAYKLSGRLGLRRMRMQIEAHSDVYAQANRAMEAVVAALDLYTGELPDGTRVRRIFVVDGPRDYYDDIAKLHTVSTDFMVWFYE